LVSAAYIPTLNLSNISVKPAQNLQLGYGVRVGALQESLLVPGVSISYIKRDLPTTTITASDPSFGSFTLSDAAIKTSSWRIVASKSLILFGVAAGVGQDKYDESASFAGTANTGIVLQPTQSFGPFALAQNMKRTNYFVDLSMNLILLKLVGEVGQVSGGALAPTPFNTFSTGAANDSRTYASIGARFGF
jgi:hypothetical protein